MPEFTLGKLASQLGATLKGGDPTSVVNSLAPLAEATSGQLSFLGNAKYRKHLADTQAEAVLLSASDAAECPVPMLIVENPDVTFVTLAGLFERKLEPPTGIHATAVIGNGCRIDESASIGPHCVIGNGVSIGKNSLLLPGTVVGDDVTIGNACILHANVTVYARTRIANRVTLHSGAVVGSDGFGNINQKGRWVKSPQLGCVVIHDDVNIGATTTIDCGALGDTVIGEGVKLDNGIQIAHNVHIGAHTAIAAHTGIAGSTHIGSHCMIGGKVGIGGHLTICDRVIITADSGITKSLTKPDIYSSTLSVRPHREWNKNLARFGKLNEMYKRLMKLEKKLEEVSLHELD